MRTVIWDLGGTLVDTYPDVDRTLATAVHASPDAEDIAEVAQLTRRSSSLAISTLAERHGVPEQRLRAAYDALKDRWARQPPPAMEGARQVLGTVRAGGGSNLVSTNRDRQSATVLLEALGLEVEIDDMVCAPDGFPRKPDPTMVRVLLERSGLAPEQCLAVGDRPADVEAAARVGVPGALLITPGIPLSAPGAVRISSLTSLLDLLRTPDQG
ncbi:MAG TPA: HAD family hydrolase [Candidatus Brachybacterium merdavium]|uniref:HAD family hydrolase n=1 Tax=Candidatus Brachybacterium merdavium TaxID=2838513 RepID=A0A9D2LC49_9MICO|nr:HAD family hydrolase [Candidatus Brachybacterium merdavium]